MRTPPDPTAVEALSRRTGHVLAFLVATLLVTMMPFPVQVAAGLFALGALVTGARAVVLAWRAGVRTPALGALAGLVVLAGVMVLSFATMVAFWPAQQANAECVRLAVTTSAREACAEQLQRDVEDVLEGVLVPAGR
ncbi:hypothetical protein Q9R32_08880 [Actinotalea sp. AC32]|nr:hypothetical protein [Actinotalea sp. AC32]